MDPHGNSSVITYGADDEVPVLNITIQGRPRHIFVETQVGLSIIKYVYPIIILLGTIGNVLALIVLLRKRMRNTSVNVYLAILACADTGVLYSNAFRNWIRAISQFDVQHTSDFSCKMITFLFLVSLHMSAWLVVAISADRFVAIWFPFKSMMLCTVRRARLISLAMFIIMLLYNCHVFFTMHLQSHPPNSSKPHRARPYCGALKDDMFMQEVYPWTKLATYSCVPFILVLILNSCIIFKIVCRLGPRGAGFKDSQSTPHSVAEAKITTMLLVVSLCWLVLTAPYTLWTFLAKPTKDPHERSRDILAKIICFMLMFINHAINFYLYCVTGNNFRREFWDWILCRPVSTYRNTSVMKTTATTVRCPTDVFPEQRLLRDDTKMKESYL